jgi:hypothetical protein
MLVVEDTCIPLVPNIPYSEQGDQGDDFTMRVCGTGHIDVSKDPLGNPKRKV